MFAAVPDIAAIDHSLSVWEVVEYAAEAFVILGCVGEFIADFTRVKTEAWRHHLGRLSLLILIAALGVELVALVRSNTLAGREIALLNGVAAEAGNRAATANARVKEAEAEIASAEARIAEANRAAAEANATAETERLERLRLEARLAPRTLSPAQQASLSRSLAPLNGRSVDVLIYGSTPEIDGFAFQIGQAAYAAGIHIHVWHVISGAGIGIVVQTRFGSDHTTDDDARLITSALHDLGTDCKYQPQRFGEELPGALNGATTWDPQKISPIRLLIGAKP
jgi:hypothetical protein